MSFVKEGLGVGLFAIAQLGFALLIVAGAAAWWALVRSFSILVLSGVDATLNRLQGTNKEIKACQPAGAPSARPRAIAHAEYALNLLSSLVPTRIANEEIGDALEVIHAMAKEQRPAWSIYVRVAMTYLFVGIHTAQHYAVQLFGVVKIARGPGDDRR